MKFKIPTKKIEEIKDLINQALANAAKGALRTVRVRDLYQGLVFAGSSLEEQDLESIMRDLVLIAARESFTRTRRRCTPWTP